jgi:hypothetical protein
MRRGLEDENGEYKILGTTPLGGHWAAFIWTIFTYTLV